MSIIPKKRSEQAAQPTIQSEAPAAHVDALLRILEDTDEALTPMTSRGMDGRTATILKEIEKSGAISVRTQGDNIWIDVLDRKKALTVVDRLIESLK